MSEREFIALFYSTLLCMVTVTPFIFIWSMQDNFKKPVSVAVDEGRNENSTPRTFVLPANPAVVTEQERKVVLEKNREQIQRCIIALLDEGYELANVEMITSDDVFVETLRYQFNTSLTPTGKLDDITREKLGC